MRKASGSDRTAPQRIAEALRDEIAKGALQPGQALRQDDLAARFGVSRIPVREALRRLEEDGLVTVHANRGAFVTTLTDEDVVEIFDVRLLLESDLAKRATTRATDEMFDEVEAVLVRAERGSRTAEWSELDGAFHRALYACADRGRQVSMVMALRALVQRLDANEALPTRAGEWLENHRQLLTACRRRDGDEAARLVTRHLERARALVRDRLAATGPRSSTGDPYYDEVRWRKAMLDIRPNCECCDRDLPNGDPDARICTFECTFCARCVEELFDDACPNCGGNLVERPTRPTASLDKAPPSRQRVLKHHPERERLSAPAAL